MQIFAIIYRKWNQVNEPTKPLSKEIEPPQQIDEALEQPQIDDEPMETDEQKGYYI